MSGVLRRASVRHLVRHPWQFALSVLGIALGVAVALSIDLATESARRAFTLATEAVTGRATHQIVGGPAGLPEDVYRTLRVGLGARDAAPIVAFDVAVVGHPGETLHLLGVDPFAERPFRRHLMGAEPSIERPGAFALLEEVVARPATGLIASATARRLGRTRGDSLVIRVAGRVRSITLVGWLAPADGLDAQAMESLLVTEMATAQELAGASGHLSRIDLIVTDDA